MSGRARRLCRGTHPRQHEGRAERRTICVVGTGIGGDVIIGGKSMRSVNPSSCEIGHMITHMDGKRCSCGNHGCFEAYASASALSGMTNGKFTAGEIAKRAKDGEAEFPTIWKSYIDELCCGIMNCIILYSPEVVCVGGGLSLSGEFLIRSVREGLEESAYQDARKSESSRQGCSRQTLGRSEQGLSPERRCQDNDMFRADRGLNSSSIKIFSQAIAFPLKV